MKRLFYSVTFLVFSWISFTANAQQDARAKAVLDQMSKKFQSTAAFEASFAYTLVNEATKVNDSMEGKIAVKGEKFRAFMDGQEIFYQKGEMWTYIAEANEVTITNEDKDAGLEFSPYHIYTMYTKGYKYLLLEDEDFNGESCYIVDLVPDNKKLEYFKVRLSISKSTNLLKGWKIFTKNGNRHTFSISSYNTNVQLDDAYFTFDKKKYPAGLEIVDLRDDY